MSALLLEAPANASSLRSEIVSQRVFSFDGYTVDVDAREIRLGGERVPVEPQVFGVLEVLLRERHRVVAKQDLLDEVWGTRFVSESALSSRIKALRRALGDNGNDQRVIRTAHGHGFRFVADVDQPQGESTVPLTSARGATGPAESSIEQDIRFCAADDGTRLAYAISGAGAPLVKVANWLTHIEYDLETSVWRHWLRDLSARFRLIRYDERGCGLSDLDTDRFDLDAWVEDLRCVIDAAGLDKVPLLGISQGGAVAIAFAVRHPERVSKLVLYGAYARGPYTRAATEAKRREAQLMPELAALGWGTADPTFRQVFTMRFVPEGTAEDWEAFNELQRRTTTPDNAERFLRAFNQIHVDHLAQQVQVPTLVIHARRDHMPPIEEGRRLAALIPGSRFVSLDSPNHLLLGTEPAWPRFLEHVESFLADEPLSG